jgi:hypothetical protein
LPYPFNSASLQTIDGAGNLILTFANQLIKVDPSGVESLLATIQPESGILGSHRAWEWQSGGGRKSEHS